MVVKPFKHIMIKVAHCVQFISIILYVLNGEFLYKNYKEHELLKVETSYTARFCIQEHRKHRTYCGMGCASEAVKDHSFIFEFLSKELACDCKGLDERCCLHVKGQPEFE
jgi:hypothetical protein